MLVALVVLLGLLPLPSGAQDRLKTMPGYEQYQKLSQEIPGRSSWIVGRDLEGRGKAFDFQKDGVAYRYDIAERKLETQAKPRRSRSALKADAAAWTAGGVPRGGRSLDPFARRQAEAFYRDHNLWLSDAQGSNETPITTDGHEKNRIKYGTASWSTAKSWATHRHVVVAGQHPDRLLSLR